MWKTWNFACISPMVHKLKGYFTFKEKGTFQAEVFDVVTPCNVVGYQHFEEPSFLHL
jgi:hypothetical protein